MANPTGIKAIADGRRDVFNVDPRKLHIKEGWNSRDFNDPSNIEHVDNLAQSIAAVGVKEPLTIFFENGVPYVTNGECRLRATRIAIDRYKADIKTVPVWSEDRYSNEADRLLNQFIRNTGKPFSPIELSSHFKRMLGLGWKATDIAAKAGMSQARVSQILNLQTLPEAVKAMVVQKQVAASTAVALVKAEGGAVAEQQLKAGLEAALAVGQTKVMPKHLTQPVSETIVPASNKPPVPWPVAAAAAPMTASVMTAPVKQLKTALKEAFDASEIDNSATNVVIIEMPPDQFEIVRKLLEL